MTKGSDDESPIQKKTQRMQVILSPDEKPVGAFYAMESDSQKYKKQGKPTTKRTVFSPMTPTTPITEESDLGRKPADTPRPPPKKAYPMSPVDDMSDDFVVDELVDE